MKTSKKRKSWQGSTKWKVNKKSEKHLKQLRRKRLAKTKKKIKKIRRKTGKIILGPEEKNPSFLASNI